MSKTKSIALIIGVLTMTLAVGYLAIAWTEPIETPPGDNVPTPINVGAINQIKTGGLGIGGGFYADSPTFVVDAVNDRVGIGTTSPSTKLDVVGNIRVTGLISCNTIDTDASGNLTCGTDESGAGGGVTSLSAGTGITLSPNPITSTGTISANTTYLQRRVTGTCAAGSAIRVINSNGTVTCQSMVSGNTFVVCVNGTPGWFGTTWCSCGGGVQISKVSTSGSGCTVTSDTGSCSAVTAGGGGSDGSCCVCRP